MMIDFWEARMLARKIGNRNRARATALWRGLYWESVEHQFLSLPVLPTGYDSARWWAGSERGQKNGLARRNYRHDQAQYSSPVRHGPKDQGLGRHWASRAAPGAVMRCINARNLWVLVTTEFWWSDNPATRRVDRHVCRSLFPNRWAFRVAPSVPGHHPRTQTANHCIWGVWTHGR